MNTRRTISLNVPLAVFLLVLPAAQAEEVLMKLRDTPSGHYAGIYISPYALSVGDVAPVDMLLNCDDFVHDVSIGDTWRAEVIRGTSGNLLSTQMAQAAKTAGLIHNESGAEALYDAKAWIEIHKLNVAGTDNYLRAVASYAIWRLFEPTAVDGYLASHASVGFRDDVTKVVTNAKAEANGSGLHKYLTIYSPKAPIFSGPHQGRYAQEYDCVHVPDSGTTLMFFGGALFGLETFRRKLRL